MRTSFAVAREEQLLSHLLIVVEGFFDLRRNLLAWVQRLENQVLEYGHSSLTPRPRERVDCFIYI